jgi:cysteine desulfurase
MLSVFGVGLQYNRAAMRPIYLDYNATTPLREEVLEAMLPFLRENYGNPSSIHSFGRAARVALDEARWRLAQLLGCDEGEIVFTSGGTEAANLAVLGAARAAKVVGKNHIITSSIEHHCVLHACRYLEKCEGFAVTYLPVSRDCLVDPEEVRRAICKETALVSVMWANNETGTVQPVAEIEAICRERGVLFHTDAVQAFGKIASERGSAGVSERNTSTLPADLLSISAHKFYGPKGVGALVVKKGTKIHPTMHGGAQEREKRAGTENVAGIVGMARAAELAVAEQAAEETRLRELTETFWRDLSGRVTGVHRNGHPTRRVANTASVSFEGVDGEALLMNLDLEGVAVSSGAACAAGAIEPSHVLLAMGVPLELAKATVRFSLGRNTTAADVEATRGIVEKVVQRLRGGRGRETGGA